MTNYVLWRCSLRGPAMAVLFGSPNLEEYDKANRLELPVPIKHEHAGLLLDELAKLYPAPAATDDTPQTAG